jgi:hypothetical protein
MKIEIGDKLYITIEATAGAVTVTDGGLEAAIKRHLVKIEGLKDVSVNVEKR